MLGQLVAEQAVSSASAALLPWPWPPPPGTAVSADAAPTKPISAGAEDDERERHAEEEDADEGRRRERRPCTRFFSARLPMRTTASSTIASTAALSPKNSAATSRHLPQRGIDVAQRQDRDEAGHDEQAAGDEAARGAVHQPADVGGELLRLGARQQHAVVERVQEPRLGDPALLLDEDAVHDRDLPRRAAEAQQRDARPRPGRFGKGDAVRGKLSFFAARLLLS